MKSQALDVRFDIAERAAGFSLHDLNVFPVGGRGADSQTSPVSCAARSRASRRHPLESIRRPSR